MKGRQATWFQVVGIDQLIREIRGCTTDLLQECLREMPHEERANLVRLQQELQDSIIEELADDFFFHRYIPYSAISIYWGEIRNGSTEAARGFAHECLKEYDALISKGLYDRIH